MEFMALYWYDTVAQPSPRCIPRGYEFFQAKIVSKTLFRTTADSLAVKQVRASHWGEDDMCFGGKHRITQRGNYTSATLGCFSKTSQPLNTLNEIFKAKSDWNQKENCQTPACDMGFTQVQLSTIWEAGKQNMTYGMIFYFFPHGASSLHRSCSAPTMRWDEMESHCRSCGTLSHYQHVGFGIKTLRQQIRGTKPQGFVDSIEMQRAINFIICLQMRSTLPAFSGVCGCVFVCSGGGVRFSALRECRSSLCSEVTSIRGNKEMDL